MVVYLAVSSSPRCTRVQKSHGITSESKLNTYQLLKKFGLPKAWWAVVYLSSRNYQCLHLWYFRTVRKFRPGFRRNSERYPTASGNVFRTFISRFCYVITYNHWIKILIYADDTWLNTLFRPSLHFILTSGVSKICFTWMTLLMW